MRKKPKRRFRKRETMRLKSLFRERGVTDQGPGFAHVLMRSSSDCRSEGRKGVLRGGKKKDSDS